MALKVAIRWEFITCGIPKCQIDGLETTLAEVSGAARSDLNTSLSVTIRPFGAMQFEDSQL